MEYQINSGIRFSSKEVKDLVIAWLAISLIFAQGTIKEMSVAGIALALLIPLVTVGVGFLLHELAHKFTAQYYGCWAEFRSDYVMLGISFLISVFTGVILLAPGAVLISGNINKRRNGIISLAGPLTNIGIAILFFVLTFTTASTTITPIYKMGFMINAFLAVFNLIPFGILDCSKVLGWNKIAYVFSIAGAILLLVISYMA
jgi:Zn-dependent protease